MLSYCTLTLKVPSSFEVTLTWNQITYVCISLYTYTCMCKYTRVFRSLTLGCSAVVRLNLYDWFVSWAPPALNYYFSSLLHSSILPPHLYSMSNVLSPGCCYGQCELQVNLWPQCVCMLVGGWAVVVVCPLSSIFPSFSLTSKVIIFFLPLTSSFLLLIFTL